jgi:hypothetical protein
MNETPEATPITKTPDYYRVHSYEKRGPDAGERKAYLGGGPKLRAPPP